MNLGYILIKTSTIQQIPYRIFNAKSIFLTIININFDFNTILTFNSCLINLISATFFDFHDLFTSQNIL